MGNTPSKTPEQAVADEVRDRRRALEIKEISPEVEKDYVYVADEERMHSSP